MGRIKIFFAPPTGCGLLKDLSLDYKKSLASLDLIPYVLTKDHYGHITIDGADLCVFVDEFFVGIYDKLKEALDSRKQILILYRYDEGKKINEDISRIVSGYKNLVKVLPFSNLTNEIASCVYECVESFDCLRMKKNACCAA